MFFNIFNQIHTWGLSSGQDQPKDLLVGFYNQSDLTELDILFTHKSLLSGALIKERMKIKCVSNDF